MSPELDPYASDPCPLRTQADWWVNCRRAVKRHSRFRDVFRWHADGRWLAFLFAESQTRKLSAAEYEREFLDHWHQYFLEVTVA